MISNLLLPQLLVHPLKRPRTCAAEKAVSRQNEFVQRTQLEETAYETFVDSQFAAPPAPASAAWATPFVGESSLSVSHTARVETSASGLAKTSLPKSLVSEGHDRDSVADD